MKTGPKMFQISSSSLDAWQFLFQGKRALMESLNNIHNVRDLLDYRSA